MPTRPLPAGTVNFAVNLPVPLRRDAGRLAFMQGDALGRWVREMIEREVVAARLRGAIDAAGQMALRLPAVALGLLGVAAVMTQLFSVDSQQVARRVGRRGRRRDEIELVEEC
jgi:hypothetical protein